MDKSETIDKLAAALSKAQDQMGGAVKDAENPFFSSTYADMASVVSAIKQPFADNGLSYSQFPLMEGENVGVETILMHSSGQWISSVLVVPMKKKDAQAAGSAITYTRRYALQAIAGVPSEDDDGSAASELAKVVPDKSRVVTADDQRWINAINAGTSKIEDITDPVRRQFIQGKLK